MARLQRKKSQEEKRKKRQSKTSEAGPSASDSDGAPTVSTAGTSGVLKPKTTSTPRKDAAEARARSDAGGKVGGWFRQAGQFIREAKVELKKVAWPSRKQTIGSTAVVLVLVFAIAAFLGLADMVLAGIVKWVLQ